MRVIGSQNLLELGTFNGLIPGDGPKSLPVRIDFSVDQVWKVDLSQQTSLKILGYIQCAFIDNSASAEPLYIETETVRQQLVIPPYSQGYVPVLAARPPIFNLQSAGGIPITIHFLNVPMPLAIWSVVSPPQFSFNDAGELLTNPAALTALIADAGDGPGLNVNVLGGGGGGGGGGLRLPADYGAVRAELTSSVNTNVIAAAPRFYMNAVEITLSPNAFISPIQVVTLSMKRGSVPIREITFYPGTAVPTTGPAAPMSLLSLSGLDYWSPVDGENLAFQLSAGLSGATPGGVQITVWGGSGAAP